MAFSGSLEDRAALHELLSAYADAVNQRDAEAWGALWCEDAVWSLPEESGFGTVKGREQIVDAWKGAMGYFPDVVFLATMGRIAIEGDRATMRSYTSETYHHPETGLPHLDRGQYDDELVRVGPAWKFRSRRFRHLYRG